MSERFSRRHPQMISSVCLPTALVSAPTYFLNVSGLFPLRPNTFLAETPLSTPSFDTQVRLHLWPSNRTGSCNKSTSTCARFGSRRRTDGFFQCLALHGYQRNWNGFGFLKIVLCHHTYQRTMLRTDTDTLLLCLRQPFIV